MAEVSLQRVSKVYEGGVKAVVDLSVDIADGEFVVLVGPSGCGKTTTLRMIAGLEDVSDGDIRIAGRSVVDLPPGRRDIAMVFQNYALYPHMTVRRNMEFGLKMRGVRRADRATRVRQVASQLQLDELLDRRPRELSGGQRQRVALGRAIVRDPQVFLFDEPLSNLDAKLRVHTRTELAALHRRLGATMVYVTHDQVEAMTLADRLVLMEGGVVKQIGTPMEIYHRPANSFAATFIGSPAMNLLPAEIRGGKISLADATLALPAPVALPDQDVWLGIRPEHVELGNGALPLADAVVESVEHLGHETLLRVSLAGGDLTVRVQDQSVRIGESLPLSIDPTNLHLFSRDETGQRLEWRDQSLSTN